MRRYGLDALWLAWIARALWVARHPIYLPAAGDPPFPWARAGAVCALLTAEAFALHLFLRPATYRGNWRRAAAALAAFGPLWLWTIAHTFTDQNPIEYVHGGFLTTVILLLLGCLTVAIVGRWRRHRQWRSETRAA